MKRIGCFALAVCLIFAANCGANTLKAKPLKQLQNEFLQLKFGLFVHLGRSRGPLASFDPKGLDCGQWADAALAAGMKYGVLTTKHHDGFCLWDSTVTRYDVASTLYNKDIVKQFVDALNERNMKVGLYYSIWDKDRTRHRRLITPEKVGEIKTQLTELLSNYGRIDYLWLDGYENIERPRCKYPTVREVPWDEIYKLTKKLQPNCLVMRHPGSQYDTDCTDIQIWEGVFHRAKIKKFYERFLKEHPGRPQEICDTLQGNKWHWRGDLPLEKLRSVDYVINALKTCGKNRTNYLLNAGPNPNGRLDDNVVQRLKEIGIARKKKD